jgi:hypothetical protein
MDNKGQAGVIVVVVGLIVGLIMLIAVLFPITVSTIAGANLSGTNKSIGDIIPTFILIGALVLVAGLAYMGLRK